MKQKPNDTPTQESSDDSQLDRPERNRYFHGKLMTARDMQVEQQYHRGQFSAHARHVSGEGVVCGLDVDVEGTNDGGLVITVDPGYALDSNGQPVVVPNKTTEELGPAEAPDGPRISLYIDYSECVIESVPVPGSEKSCEEECAYNRVLETFEIRCVDGGPEAGTVKSVPEVDFPTRKQVENDGGNSSQGPTNAELATIARSFTMDGDDAAACETGEPTVFLGVFDHAGGTTWEWAHDVPRSRVYTNDMLYAATARHTADFANPHKVSLETKTVDLESVEEKAAALHVEDDDPDDNVTVRSTDDTVAIDATGDKQLDLTEGQSITDLKKKTDDHIADETNPHQVSLGAKPAPGSAAGAALHVEDDESADANVTVTSTDDTVAVSADADSKVVDLTAGEALIEIIEDRLAPMAQYVMDKTLKYKLRTFSGVADAFGSEAAGRVAERTRDAIHERTYTDREAYLSFLGEIHELEREVAGELEGQATAESLDRYAKAIDRLGGALEGADESAVLHVAVAQDEVCEAAEWLEVANDDLRESLQRKRDAFARVAERFESEGARAVVEMTESAIANGAHTQDETYRRFMEEVVGRERRVASELEGTVTASSHERYVRALRELLAVLETGDVRDVATAQNGVSEAAARLVRGEEPPDELLSSLQRKREAFAGVAERFDSDVARDVVSLAEEVLNANTALTEERYLEYMHEIYSAERNLATELEGVASPASLENYSEVLGRLGRTLDEGASARDVATAQNRVSRAAMDLSRVEESPDEVLVASLEEMQNAFAGVAERFDSTAARRVVSLAEELLSTDVTLTGERYVEHMHEIYPAERNLVADLEGAASPTSLENYDASLDRLGRALDGGASARELASVQNGVSRIATDLSRVEESPDEVLVASLEEMQQAFAGVAERFGSDAARRVASMAGEAMNASPATSGDAYVAFIQDVIRFERAVAANLEGTATAGSLENYRGSLARLASALEEGASPRDVAAAQNGVSQAATELSRVEETPDEALLSSLKHKREAFAGVVDRFDSEVARDVVAMTEDALGGTAATNEGDYRSFIGEVSSAEQELLGEIGNAVTQESGERYDDAIATLGSVFEGDASVYKVASAQNGVSEAAGALTPSSEESPDETLLTSLKNAQTAFSGVVDRFDSDAARNVVEGMDFAINEGVATSADRYVEFIGDVITDERNLTTDLEGVVTPTSLERYDVTLSRLGTALEQGASARELASVQNGVSQAATQLARAEETPDEALQSSLLSTRSAFSGVVERFDTQVAQDVVSMTTKAIDGGVATSGENYLGFVADLLPVERKLSSELEGAASSTTLESYDAAVAKLGNALEQGASPRDVAAVQDGVSRAAAGLQAGSEEPTSEDLQTSLKIKHDNFSTVVERFNNTIAQDVLTMTERALESNVAATPEEYVAFVRGVAQHERDLLEALKGTATQSSLGRYAVAVDELVTAIGNEASALDLAAAQNKVSQAAGALESSGDALYTELGGYTTFGGSTFDLLIDPTDYTVSELRTKLETISDPMVLQEMLATEMTTSDRTTAKDAIRARLKELTQ